MRVWLENAHSCPFWGFLGTFPPHDVTHRTNPKRTVLGLNHVIWAMKRECRSRGSSWALEREKGTGQENSHKRVIFQAMYMKKCLVADALDVITSLHVCRVLQWNLQGLRFYRGSNFFIFSLIFEWALQQCSAVALPMKYILQHFLLIFIIKEDHSMHKNSSEDEIANTNVLRRHRTCRVQSLRPLNWVPNFYYNYASMVIYAPNHLCTYAHHTELSEFVLPK